ncbi:hypothetical protein MLD38_020023 [Melastoma candidum]|uniref:Uncharacterized protein n=1 Tax=Melastoma candidum TaxID=119954 RepID=A0ACB9QBZ5_9MYRT|nr:hypothetical protein MLD38_020023 [Melastoma candidum]
MEQHCRHAPSVDHRLIEGETIVIPRKNPWKSKDAKPKTTEGLSNLIIEEKGNDKLVRLKPSQLCFPQHRFPPRTHSDSIHHRGHFFRRHLQRGW